MDSLHMRCEEALTNLEKILRDADSAVTAASTPLVRKREKRRRNAINAACNALYRATKA